MKNLYFIFYRDNEVCSERLLNLYHQKTPEGIWKFINIYDSSVLEELPIIIETLPAIYNVAQKELYEGEYVLTFMKAFQPSQTPDDYHVEKSINKRIQERDDNEIEVIKKIPPQFHNNQDPIKISPVYNTNRYETQNYATDRQRNDSRMDRVQMYDTEDTAYYSYGGSEPNNKQGYINQTQIVDEAQREYLQTLKDQTKNKRTHDTDLAKEDYSNPRFNHMDLGNVDLYDNQ